MFSKSRSDDRGSALVAAIAVAIIGMFVATLVVTQAVVVTRDAQRDAVRTGEVHAAEAALDATILLLGTQAPCPGPSWSPAVVGSGTSAVNVVVTISYADDSGPLTTCTSGNISGTPTSATVRATATPVNDTYGLSPTRAFEAKVNIVPLTGTASAVFSGGGMTQTGAGFALVPAVPGNSSNVWVDNGNFRCDSSVQITGDLMIPQGGGSFQNAACKVTGTIWSRDTFTIHSYNSANGVMIGNGIIVQRSGQNLVVQQKNIKVNGEIYLGGTLVQNAGAPGLNQTGGTVHTNQTIAALAPKGLPQITLDTTDWTGFTIKNVAGWVTDIAAGANIPASEPWKKDPLDDCNVETWNAGSNPINMPSTNTLYDLRLCTGKKLTFGGVTLRVTADLAIFAPEFYSYGITIISGDNLPHKIWFIVPVHDGSVPGYVAKQIKLDSGVNITSPLEVFMYTPSTLAFHNQSSATGQLYGGTVDVHSLSQFKYTDIGVPGVALSTVSASGAEVILVYKREVS